MHPEDGFEESSEDRRRRRAILMALALVAFLVVEVVSFTRPPVEEAPSGGDATPPAVVTTRTHAPLEAPGASSADVAARPGGEAPPDVQGRCELRVVDRATQQGVRAEVSVVQAGGVLPLSTDDEGRAVLVGPTGEVELVARAGPLRSPRQRVTLEPGETGAAVLQLEAGGFWIDGVVVDPDGRPVADATVLGFDDEGQHEPLIFDSAGQFTLDDLLEGPVTLRVEAPGFVPWWRDVVSGPGGTDTRVVLTRAARLVGLVRLPDGAPAAGVAVETQAGRAECDADGRFELLGQPAEVELHAETTDAQGQELIARRALTLPPGTTSVTLDLQAPAVLTGTLLCRGRPVHGLHLEVISGAVTRPAPVDATGSFRATGLTAGPARLAVGSGWFPGSIPLREVQLVAGQVTTVELALDGLGELAGVVTGADGGTVEVALDGVGCGYVVPDRDGRFSIPGLRPGRWTVRAVDDFVASPPVEQELGPGQVVEGLRLVAEPSGSVQVLLLDADELPVAHARVVVVTPTGLDAKRTAEAGQTWFSRLASGAVELRLDDEQALRRVARRRAVAAVRCDPVRVEVRSGEWTNAVLRLVDQP